MTPFKEFRLQLQCRFLTGQSCSAGTWRGQLIKILGLYGLIWGYIGMMEKRMETTIVYWGYIGSHRDNGKENGNYYSILGLYGLI